MKLSFAISLITTILVVVFPSVASVEDDRISKQLRGNSKQAKVEHDENLHQTLHDSSLDHDLTTNNNDNDGNQVDDFNLQQEESATKQGRNLWGHHTAPSLFHGHHGYACRTSWGGHGHEGYDYRRYNHISHHRCESHCRHQHHCKGYEYSYLNHQCQIWYTSVGNRYERRQGYSCYQKSYNNW